MNSFYKQPLALQWAEALILWLLAFIRLINFLIWWKSIGFGAFFFCFTCQWRNSRSHPFWNLRVFTRIIRPCWWAIWPMTNKLICTVAVALIICLLWENTKPDWNSETDYWRTILKDYFKLLPGSKTKPYLVPFKSQVHPIFSTTERYTSLALKQKPLPCFTESIFLQIFWIWSGCFNLQRAVLPSQNWEKRKRRKFQVTNWLPIRYELKFFIKALPRN